MDPQEPYPPKSITVAVDDLEWDDLYESYEGDIEDNPHLVKVGRNIQAQLMIYSTTLREYWNSRSSKEELDRRGIPPDLRAVERKLVPQEPQSNVYEFSGVAARFVRRPWVDRRTETIEVLLDCGLPVVLEEVVGAGATGTYVQEEGEFLAGTCLLYGSISFSGTQHRVALVGNVRSIIHANEDEGTDTLLELDLQSPSTQPDLTISYHSPTIGLLGELFSNVVYPDPEEKIVSSARELAERIGSRRIRPQGVVWLKHQARVPRGFQPLPSDQCSFDRDTVMLPEALRGRLDPDEWKPLIASSMIYERKLQGSLLLAWLATMGVTLVPFILISIFSLATLGDAGFIPFFVSAVLFTAFGSWLFSHFKRQLRLLADRKAAGLTGREPFLTALGKIDTLGVRDVEERKRRGVRFRVRSNVPDIGSRTRNLVRTLSYPRGE